MSDLGDEGRLFLGAVVTPQVVLVQRLKTFAHGKHGGAGRVECDGFQAAPVRARSRQGLAHGLRQRPHVVLVALGGMIGIFSFAEQRVLRRGGS